ncbi:protein ecdysoneless homolog [Dunckerocampus dactyliophorus]|uniref:protein ecdysoneless homolog n=1 Tax=Dunckerocampus dactyliophorus TaxID=161453 RepID=UPI002405733B|nr:protein ecdysoneless homolog [Dunckerocampus dactyliophorus]XP_054655308.1 protein ecdysoneless homolog [Dunckerocampus dactyliophorus]
MDELQRRVVQEDAVQYKLFMTQPHCSTEEEHVLGLVDDILAKVAPLSVRYIWQNQSFNLKYHPEEGGVPAHIGGSTQFGDNVEDEWFIVYLLKKITEAFPELAARVEDNDGEFLLIEVADHLPKWINPDTSENRVFLYRGALHILPCPSRSSPIGFPKDVVPSVKQALALLSKQPESCRASHKISLALDKRLNGYPEKVQASLHRAHCFIPAAVAVALAQRPDLVAPAVSAFYLRDPVDLQACRNFRKFPPDTRVLTSVMFTRCLYAQLQQQQFKPDRRSGFTLPARSHPHYNAHELGMKLAHGFEILCSKCRLPSSEDDDSVSCNPQWKGFMRSLKRNDYFQGEMEGSACYRRLVKSAETFFKQSVVSKSSGMSPGEEVLQLLRTCPIDIDKLKEQESQLPQEDSDSWLEVNAQDLERMLDERGGARADGSTVRRAPTVAETAFGGGGEEEAGYSLVAVSQKMKSFLSAMSSHEGAELPWSTSSQPFSFDPDSLTTALDRLLGGKNEEELDSDDLDEEEEEEEEDVEEVLEEEDDEKEEVPLGPAEMNGMEALDTLREYMDQMDQELMSTNIGQSFHQTNYNEPTSDKSSTQPPTTNHLPSQPAEATVAEETAEIQPLDVDLNLVTNLLESLSCQAGLAGPASNLLQSLGIRLPPNSDCS